MADILLISWIIGIITSIVGIIPLVFYFKSIHELTTSYRTKEVFVYMVITCISVLVYTTIIIIFGIIKIETINKLWLVFPLMYAFVAVSWGTGIYKLMQIIKSSREENG